MSRGRPRKYKTKEEAKIANKERAAKRYQRFKDDEDFKAANKANCKRWRKNNPEYMTEYRSTKFGRANCLLSAYRQADKAKNRGECTLTAEWIVNNVFSGQSCHYCGESDWHKLGCDRIDNRLPHTPENCVPSCWECNNRLGIEWTKECLSKPVYQYSLDGLLVAIWPSTRECGRNGYTEVAVAACCRGDYCCKTYKGYRWSYEPLQQKQQVCELELNFK